MGMLSARIFVLALVAAVFGAGCKEADTGTSGGPSTASTQASAGSFDGKLRIASYEPTVELYKDLNAAFEQKWKQQGGNEVDVETSHGPSGSQSKKIAEGNEVDVAALSVDFDIDKIAEAGILNSDWRKEFPNDAVPYTSSVVFLVRKGNPKGIKDWEDLARDDVTGLAPDPKTGGGARWIYLSAWAHALRKGGDDAAAKEFTKKVYDKAVLDPAMRQSTTRFVSQGEGDVLFGWENEILQIVNDPKVKSDYQIVLPSDSIVIEVPIAIVDKVVDRRGSREAAEAFVKFLFSDEGQDIVAKRYNRPSSTSVQQKYAQQFPALKLFRFKEHFTSWPDVMKRHFSQGGELDQMRTK